MKALKGITFVLAITTVVSVIVIILMATGVINICSNSDCTCPDCFDISVNANKLTEIKNGDYNFIKTIATKDGTYYLLANGKVNIDLDKELSNVNNAIDMALLNDELIILTKDGKVYKYNTGVTNKSKLDADLANIAGNVVKLVEYGSRRKNAGGCNYIVGITSSDEYINIAESCV